MFLIIQNDPECPPGSCVRLLADGGHPFKTVAAYSDDPFPEVTSLTGIIVLGGQMGVHDTLEFPSLRKVGALIGAARDAGTPLLGICLGGQLIAKSAGGVVSSPSPHVERGISSVALTEEGLADPLFTGVSTPFTTFQLHNDSFSLPAGATLLGSSDVCPVQAFRLGSAYALQFHPEVDRSIVSSWENLSSPSNDYLSGFLAAETPFKAASHAILANFLSLAAASRRS
jgi:GMP synthase (glutamine-hydrolysing)